MRKLIAQYAGYALYEASREALHDLAEFIVTENYRHHCSAKEGMPLSALREIEDVCKEEESLFTDSTKIYLAINQQGRIIGSIRVFKWNRHSMLPLEKIYGINPLTVIHGEAQYDYWHVGRFAIDSFSGVSTFVLFKRLMALAVRPIVHNKYNYMVAEIDSKLLRVMNALGFVTKQLGASAFYLTSETVPVCSDYKGLMGFFSKYGYLCQAA